MCPFPKWRDSPVLCDYSAPAPSQPLLSQDIISLKVTNESFISITYTCTENCPPETSFSCCFLWLLLFVLITIFSFSFSPSKTSHKPLSALFQIHGLFFINCYKVCIYICIKYTYILQNYIYFSHGVGQLYSVKYV